MLDELSAKDFGIIEAIDWKPAGGLNVITGETGAGKSLVVDAVEALLSGQAHEEDIRHGAGAAQVEGIFHLDEKEGTAALRATLAEKGLEETKTKIAEANRETRCACMVCDVTDAGQVRTAVEDCMTKFGGIDVADANVGYLDRWSKIGESDISSWWRSWEVNLKGTYYVVRYTIPHLIESARKHSVKRSTGGHLILISSVGAQLLTLGASDYQTSKHAINRLCEFINLDHGEDGIKCFAVHPGGVPTTLAKNMPEAIHSSLVDKPELAAGFIIWLCSGKADWATGRYLSTNWDVAELLQMKDQIIKDNLLVNRLRTKG